MTEFKDFEIIYNQFINLTNEIQKLIQKEDYKSADNKLELRDKIMRKISLAKKTVDFSKEENQKIQIMEQKIKEVYQINIENLKKHQIEIGEELNKTKKKVKISSAYSMSNNKKSGSIIDILE
jgi:hypothetical protein